MWHEKGRHKIEKCNMTKYKRSFNILKYRNVCLDVQGMHEGSITTCIGKSSNFNINSNKMRMISRVSVSYLNT